MGFMNKLAETIDDVINVSVTENGAIGYKTTGKALVDLNFSVASLRRANEIEIGKRFEKAFLEDRILAMKWLFYARDVRGGLGERRLFRTIMVYMKNAHPEYVRPLLKLVPEYGRWDDLWCLLDTSLARDVFDIVSTQLYADILGYRDNKPISILAKWMPSTKAHSKETRLKAYLLRCGLGLTVGEYNKTLKSLRRHLDIVEVKMSNNEWSGINYERVPSRANLIYNKAFLRRDEARRRGYLESVKKGEAKINSTVLFPHDIVNQYRRTNCIDDTLEELWKNLPDTVQGCGNTIVVSDESGSMTWNPLPNTSARALEVAEAMAIYFAERSSGEFKDKVITFSNNPNYIDLSSGKTLKDKLRLIRMGNIDMSTNIEAVFKLILKTAMDNEMKQEDLPANVLVISDMEFDSAARYPNKRLFDVIADRYRAAGYKLPRLIFWNVNARTETIPIKENEAGVALVSGFSPNIAKLVMSGKTDPYECLIEALNVSRYGVIEELLTNT